MEFISEMTDEEMASYCEMVNEKLNKWLEKQNLMVMSISDILSEAFFQGFEEGLKHSNK